MSLRTNSETRVAWEAARRVMLAVGFVESEYFPMLAIAALGGDRSVGVFIPKTIVSDGFLRFGLAQAVPALNLRWLLLDFGRRGNAHDAAKKRLLAANRGLNRKHQQVAVAVQRAFYEERDAQVTLAETLGVTPTTPIQLTDFAALPLPAELQDTVEKTIDRALERRSDLITKVAARRASEADLGRARAA